MQRTADAGAELAHEEVVVALREAQRHGAAGTEGFDERGRLHRPLGPFGHGRRRQEAAKFRVLPQPREELLAGLALVVVAAVAAAGEALVHHARAGERRHGFEGRRLLRAGRAGGERRVEHPVVELALEQAAAALVDDLQIVAQEHLQTALHRQALLRQLLGAAAEHRHLRQREVVRQLDAARELRTLRRIPAQEDGSGLLGMERSGAGRGQQQGSDHCLRPPTYSPDSSAFNVPSWFQTFHVALRLPATKWPSDFFWPSGHQ